MAEPKAVVELRELVEAKLPAPAWDWFVQSLDRIAENPAECPVRYAGAARRCGRGPLDLNPTRLSWRIDEAVRALLLYAVTPRLRIDLAKDVYHHGDRGERRAALKALDLLTEGPEGLWLVEDAVRSNDATVIQAALGPYAAHHLRPAALRQAVLKCAFLSVPFASIPEVLDRTDDELVDLLIDFVRERILAGRDVDGQIIDVIATRPDRLAEADLTAEADSDLPFRARAARCVAERLALAGFRADAPRPK
ncbi:EboA domain-containing protein [Streptomyces acidiscabies]|uniref:EboA domain-containing protein n=1 Tax=Streptomyces acidiscabies TaxID=42234 RepID=UPI0038F78289